MQDSLFLVSGFSGFSAQGFCFCFLSALLPTTKLRKPREKLKCPAWTIQHILTGLFVFSLFLFVSCFPRIFGDLGLGREN